MSRNKHSPRPHRPRPTPPRRRPPPGLWLHGRHAVAAALGNPRRVCLRLLALPDVAAELAGLRPGLAVETTDRAGLDALFPEGTVHQGLALQVEPLEQPSLGEILVLARGRERAVLVALDQVTDPHNVGAVLRSAAAFGALAVVVPDRHSPEETAVLAKAASGGLEAVPLVRVPNLARAIAEMQDEHFWVLGLDAGAEASLAEAGAPSRAALVLGSEGRGLRRLTRERCDQLVRLPILSGAVESLNVSNAAAVALYELARERS